MFIEIQKLLTLRLHTIHVDRLHRAALPAMIRTLHYRKYIFAFDGSPIVAVFGRLVLAAAVDTMTPWDDDSSGFSCMHSIFRLVVGFRFLCSEICFHLLLFAEPTSKWPRINRKNGNQKCWYEWKHIYRCILVRKESIQIDLH